MYLVNGVHCSLGDFLRPLFNNILFPKHTVWGETIMRTRVMLLFVLILFILGCHSPKPLPNNATTDVTTVVTESIEYPIWFLKPPVGLTFPTAVGYAETYRFSHEVSVEEATRDGIEQLAKHISVRIRGEVSAINERQMQYFQEIVDDSVKQLVADKHKILATHIGPKMTVVLLGLGELGAFSNQKTVSLESLPTPSWIEEIPRQKGYLYGSGHCGPRVYHESGWRTAEEDARINLALNFQSYVLQLVKQFNWQVETVSITQTNVVLNRIEVVGRWFDIKAKTYHVLVRLPLDQNTDAVLDDLELHENTPSKQ